MLSSALALAAALTSGTPSTDAIAELSIATLRAPPDLALHLLDASPPDRALALPDGRRRRPREATSSCSGDVCAPAVAVPGFEPRYGRASRSEAFVALLTRARIEPLATLAWALVSTGVRFDYSPVGFDGPNSGGHGWGSVFLRVRLRIDANATPVIPPRPR